jgi:hypothetical protein
VIKRVNTFQELIDHYGRSLRVRQILIPFEMESLLPCRP